MDINSFIQWTFTPDFYARHVTSDRFVNDLHLRFRTRQSRGMLVNAHNEFKSEYFALEVSSCTGQEFACWN